MAIVVKPTPATRPTQYIDELAAGRHDVANLSISNGKERALLLDAREICEALAATWRHTPVRGEHAERERQFKKRRQDYETSVTYRSPLCFRYLFSCTGGRSHAD